MVAGTWSPSTLDLQETLWCCPAMSLSDGFLSLSATLEEILTSWSGVVKWHDKLPCGLQMCTTASVLLVSLVAVCLYWGHWACYGRMSHHTCIYVKTVSSVQV